MLDAFGISFLEQKPRNQRETNTKRQKKPRRRRHERDVQVATLMEMRVAEASLDNRIIVTGSRRIGSS